MLYQPNGHKNTAKAASAFGSPSVPTYRWLAFTGRKNVTSNSRYNNTLNTHQGIFLRDSPLDKKENNNSIQSKNITCIRNSLPKNERFVLKKKRSKIVTRTMAQKSSNCFPRPAREILLANNTVRNNRIIPISAKI